MADRIGVSTRKAIVRTRDAGAALLVPILIETRQAAEFRVMLSCWWRLL